MIGRIRGDCNKLKVGSKELRKHFNEHSNQLMLRWILASVLQVSCSDFISHTIADAWHESFCTGYDTAGLIARLGLRLDQGRLAESLAHVNLKGVVSVVDPPFSFAKPQAPR